MRGLRVRRPMLSDPCTQLAACQLTRISPSATQKESNCVLSHSALPDTVYTQCLCHRSHLLVSEQKAIRGRLSLGEACGLVRFGVKVRAGALSAAVSSSFVQSVFFHAPKLAKIGSPSLPPQWSDGAEEVTAGEREKDGVIATDLATTLPATALTATALASGHRLREVRWCQRACRDENEACCAEQTLRNQARRIGLATTPCVRETDID